MIFVVSSIERLGSVTVSYTHLAPMMQSASDTAPVSSTAIPAHRPLPAPQQARYAVSYTHLDVYKRQDHAGADGEEEQQDGPGGDQDAIGRLSIFPDYGYI